MMSCPQRAVHDVAIGGFFALPRTEVGERDED
jgi:hypothetical protein